jgi:hypothetical protein
MTSPVDGDCVTFTTGPRDGTVLSRIAPFPTTTTRNENPDCDTSCSRSKTVCSGFVRSPMRRSATACNATDAHGRVTKDGANGSNGKASAAIAKPSWRRQARRIVMCVICHRKSYTSDWFAFAVFPGGSVTMHYVVTKMP